MSSDDSKDIGSSQPKNLESGECVTHDASNTPSIEAKPSSAATKLPYGHYLDAFDHIRKTLEDALVHRIESTEDKKYANITESVNSIVSMLIRKKSVGESNVVMVSSALPGEGKSTLSQNLWRCLGDANYKCLLIDFDLRKPTLHRHMKTPIDPGVSDLLAGDSSLDDSIRKHAENLYFMTAGGNRRINLASFGEDELPRLFENLRRMFDFIVIDTPPVLPVVDARILGEQVDSAVLSALRDKSSVHKWSRLLRYCGRMGLPSWELLFLDGVLLRMVITTEITTIEGGVSFDDLKWGTKSWTSEAAV